MKLRKIIITLAALSAMTAFANPPNGITLTCNELAGFPPLKPHDEFYMWATNNTGKAQKLHIKIFMTIPNWKIAVKEYDVNVMPGFYSMPPDFLHMTYPNKTVGLYENQMSMDVTGFIDIHAKKSCYLRVID